MADNPLPLICITGPTATGKTKLAVALAERLDAAIISADSRQVYKGMDIGTGKDLSEYHLHGKDIPHYLIDIREAGENYNIFEYRRDFDRVYESLKEEGKPVVLCGGSGMYVESVLKRYPLQEVPRNEALRQELAGKSMEELTELLKQFIRLHNHTDTETRERLLRALEIQTYYKEHDIVQTDERTDHLLFYVAYPRELLRERITQRLYQRLDEGMVEEVRQLLEQGLEKEQLTYYGLEYKWITLYLCGKIIYAEMVGKLNTAIHQFAKRQETWFRHMERNGFRLNRIDGCLDLEGKVELVMRKLHEYNKTRI
ncbi:MAG: tRNA (adenosine(37)-N6)-dimethylallyltransferase MiaA [Bacteroidales bacterium]|nr:tRNA (adenosine(37)-N6)-dimethylallyltransferase MiaA [Bacteroidales bacterium]